MAARRLRSIACLLLALLPALPILAADPEPRTGPVIEAYGPVYGVPENAFNLDPAETYRVIMDVGEGPEDVASRNRRIESAARFLNMHARSGIEPERLEFALVLHGSGARAALNEEAFRTRFGSDNPDRGLIAALAEAGVRVYLCGQSAGHRGFASDDLLPEVTLAVSAMTVHVRLQAEGYRGILF